ncbi:MAG: PDDEXK nuclease domain-containing protein [Firmicutes bacterium]|nr:PDDEXK nuclease domain-containing protein [Bacillota bacterium]
MNEIIDTNQYKEVLENIKNEILNSKYKAMRAVNNELIYLYWHVGKIILENAVWGNKFINSLSLDLKLDFPDIRGFSVRNLKYMRKFAEEYPDFQFVQSVTAQITWTHNVLLIDKTSNIEKRKWYINETVKNGWAVDILEWQIDTKLYERQAVAEKITNFENTLPDIQSDLALQTMKDPYLFDMIALKGKIKEQQIEEEMIKRIKDVLIELGSGFAFVGNQYKITVDDTDYFIDLLFYHLKLKCYIVVELKARKFKPTDAGQLNFYLSAVDDLVKDKTDNPTIGLLLCKVKNKFTAEYALKDINKPIGVSEYKLLEDIPEYLEGKLPKAEDIELHIKDIEE